MVDKLLDTMALVVLGLLFLPFVPFIIMFAVGSHLFTNGAWVVIGTITLSCALYVLFYVLLKYHILIA